MRRCFDFLKLAFAPLQPPDAVHDVAFVELHVNVLLPPLLTVVGEAVSTTVGGGVELVTVTEALAWAVPPAPVQVSMNVALAFSVRLDSLKPASSRSSLPTRCTTSHSSNSTSRCRCHR